MQFKFISGSYQKLLCAILTRVESKSRRGILSYGNLKAIGCDDICSFSSADAITDEIHCFGLESSNDIDRFEKRVSSDVKNKDSLASVIYIVRINRENFYEFSTSSLENRSAILVLEHFPQSGEARAHLFSLFHKLLLQRRNTPFQYYYSEVLAKLSSCESTLDCVPDVIKCLGGRRFRGALRVFRERIFTKFNLDSLLSRLRARANPGKMERKELKLCRHALITGWYGTETSGDKAILMELVDVLEEKCPGIKISITSIVPGWSLLTNLELGLSVEVLELRSLSYRKLDSVDLVVFGGGPLMDSSQLKYIDTLFGWAHARGAGTMIFGCGVGPLKTDFGRSKVTNIILNTDYAFFRDEKSAELAKELGLRGPALHACDPALRYVTRWRERRDVCREAVGEEAFVVALLREQTKEYSDSASEVTSCLLEELRGLFQAIIRRNKTSVVRLLPMHTFWLGNDDREYLVKVAKGFSSDKVAYCSDALSLESLLKEISKSTFGLPMRYHGHIFMLALDIPFLSVDYTGKAGKIANLLGRFDLLEYSIASDSQIHAAELLLLWNRILMSRENIQSKIRVQRDRDLHNLEQIYSDLWD